LHIFWKKVCESLFRLSFNESQLALYTVSQKKRANFETVCLEIIPFERQKVDKKQTYTKTEASKLYSRLF